MARPRSASKKRGTRQRMPVVAYVLVFRLGREYHYSAREKDGREVEEGTTGYRGRSAAYKAAQEAYPGVPVHHTA